MLGPYVHNIDPIMGSVFGICLWWYGLSYTLGFLNAHRFITNRRGDVGLDLKSVYDLSLLLAGGVLLGGRFVEVVFYERPFYSEHLHLIPAFWLGGMATHGLLFGGLAGIWAFCQLNREPFLRITDALAIPAAFILGVGRIGNFIDGQIVGGVTTVWWAFKFPDAEGFRHPVVLYDGMKNLLIIPVLWYVARRKPATGVLTGLFLFLYAFLRIFIDVFREYPTSLLGLPTGQTLNVGMSLLGMILIVFALRSKHGPAGNDVTTADEVAHPPGIAGMAWRRMLFVGLLLFSLAIPSDWTQDVPERYGKRHAGLVHSAIYPRIDTSPKKEQLKIHPSNPQNQTMQPTR